MSTENVTAVWTFYRLDNGMATGATYSGSQALLNLNTPSGCGAYQGAFDVFAQKIDLVTLQPTAYQPPAPLNDTWQTWAWDATAQRWTSMPTEAAQMQAAKAAYEIVAQSRLDGLAQSWGYDNIVSACSYATSTVAQFKAEAQTLVDFRDATWTAAYALQASIAAGTSPLPATEAEFLALLPAPPGRPEAT